MLGQQSHLPLRLTWQESKDKPEGSCDPVPGPDALSYAQCSEHGAGQGSKGLAQPGQPPCVTVSLGNMYPDAHFPGLSQLALREVPLARAKESGECVGSKSHVHVLAQPLAG